MSDPIRIKRRAAGGLAGAPSTLLQAELAYNEQDNTVYIGVGTGGSGGSATTIIPVAGAGAFVDTSSAQTVSGVKAFSSSPTAPTAAAGDSSTKVATTAFVANATGVSPQAQNTVQAGPVSGANATPTYRLLVANDIPSLLAVKISDFSTAADARITAQKGVNSGLATLDSGGTLTATQIPTSLRGAMKYFGTWNASANTPILTSSTGTQGAVYKVTTAGSTTLDGNTQWNIGDEVVFNGATWDKWDGVSSEVLSVNSQTGAVVLTKSDIGLANVPNVDATARANHTGSQLASTISDFASAVIAQVLTGLSTVTATAVTATDSILAAIGKLQAQATAQASSIAGKLTASNNLSDLLSAPTARTNLGLGSVATLSSTAVSLTANNLSDLASVITARTNLGLGTMATQSAGAVAITGGTIDGVTIDGGTF